MKNTSSFTTTTEPMLTFHDDRGFEGAINTLLSSDKYKILRKITFPNPAQINLLNITGFNNYSVHNAVYLDTETTGLSHIENEVIQLCLLPFHYAVSPDKNHSFIIGVQAPYVGFQEPSKPITQDIIDLTGITMDMLIGQRLNHPHIENILNWSELVVAHNAAFDRPFTHRISRKFSEKKWACSMNNVNWKALGFESLKLTHLASDLGFYFEPHQADKDCLAGLAILAQISKDGVSYFEKLLNEAIKDSVSIRAEFAPFEVKDILKSRGYKWKDGTDGKVKGWETTVSIDQLESERIWLSEFVYNGIPKFSERRMNAFNRFIE